MSNVTKRVSSFLVCGKSLVLVFGFLMPPDFNYKFLSLERRLLWSIFQAAHKFDLPLHLHPSLPRKRLRYDSSNFLTNNALLHLPNFNFSVCTFNYKFLSLKWWIFDPFFKQQHIKTIIQVKNFNVWINYFSFLQIRIFSTFHTHHLRCLCHYCSNHFGED